MGIFINQWEELRLGWKALLASGISALSIFLMSAMIRQVEYHYTSKYCPDRLQAIGREGKFVKVNFWEFACVAKTSNGSYVQIDSIRNIIQE